MEFDSRRMEEKEPLMKEEKGKARLDWEDEDIEHLEYSHLKEVEPKEMSSEEIRKRLREERAKLVDQDAEDDPLPVIKPNRRLRKRKEVLRGEREVEKPEWIEEIPEQEIDYSRVALTGTQEDLDCEMCGKAPCIWECVDCRDIGYCGAKCMEQGWKFHVNSCPARQKEKEKKEMEIIKREEEQRLLGEQMGRFPILWMAVETVLDNAKSWWDYIFN